MYSECRSLPETKEASFRKFDYQSILFTIEYLNTICKVSDVWISTTLLSRDTKEPTVEIKVAREEKYETISERS